LQGVSSTERRLEKPLAKSSDLTSVIKIIKEESRNATAESIVAGEKAARG